jgi:hypothetical protein
MADLTKCNGDNCPVKEHCYRFTALADKYGQSYFVDSPGEHLDNGKFECSHYWGENDDKIRPSIPIGQY